jgi:4-amino-4-deoxy-L-arabinose transferase-like glycosyltransferase
MQPAPIPKRPPANTILLLALWMVFYASFTLFTPALLDDADSVHAEVAREMLLRHDWVTLYANGIRYLEKAPLLYWSMATSFKLFGVSAAAARIPLALTVLALAFAVEAFARRGFRNARAGLYASLILLSCFGIFLFTRILLPDAMLSLWLTLALFCFYLTEQPPEDRVPLSSHPYRDGGDVKSPRLLCYAFAVCCALGVLTKGLIGGVFPVAIVLIYLLLTRGLRAAITRIHQLHPISSLVIFLAIAAPWHILIALANPAQGHPSGLTLAHGHLSVPLPSDGNVHGWLWFYFVNEQMLRYVNLRVPRDYDTVPLGLFWGLCLVWLMPWSAYMFKALADAVRNYVESMSKRSGTKAQLNWVAIFRGLKPRANPVRQGGAVRQGDAVRQCDAERRGERVSSTCEGSICLLLILWAAIPLLFFSFSTRQEYYVLPALSAVAMLIAGWLALDEEKAQDQPATQWAEKIRRTNMRATAVLVVFGSIFAAAVWIFLLQPSAPAHNADLAQLLQQHPADYALSMGHFLDLNTQALGLFRLPLALAAAALFLGPLCSFLLRKKNRPHAATLSLAAGAFGFLLAAHLGLQTFAPVLSSQQLAAAIAPQLHADDLIVIHQEYEFASTLGFYLQRPSYALQNGRPVAVNPIHILEGRSSDLWYGSFFVDAPAIFETPQSLAEKWSGHQRIFLWQNLANQPSPLPALPTPVYVIARSGGKEIVSNQSDHP